MRAADAPAPSLHAYATDLTATLSAAQLAQLNTRLEQLQQAKGAQLLVLMVPNIGDQDIDSYSLAVVEANKMGRKGVDDGVLLLVVKDQHQARIEVGYGLEGAIPDAAAARIIREYLAPKFRQQDYAGGIEDGVGALTGLINGEPLPPPIEAPPRHQGGFNGSWLVLVLVISALVRQGLSMFPLWLRSLLAAVLCGGILWLLASALLGLGGAVLAAALVWLLSGSSGGGFFGGGGGWGGLGGWGGSRGGGGSSGGFSGGGGSFGGGGASGNW